jgi:hypothetical protein
MFFWLLTPDSHFPLAIHQHVDHYASLCVVQSYYNDDLLFHTIITTCIALEDEINKFYFHQNLNDPKIAKQMKDQL